MATTTPSSPSSPSPPAAAPPPPGPDAEAELLTSFLLAPASLKSVMTAAQFRALFPRAVVQGSPALLRSLWRDLQTQRGRALDTVAASVEVEARLGGTAVRREVARQRRDEVVGWEEDGEVEMDRALFANTSAAKKSRHSLDSIVPQLDAVVKALEAEIAAIAAQEAAVKENLGRTVVDGLGGLVRSTVNGSNMEAPLADPNLPEEVRRRLENLREVCNRKV